MLASTGIEVVEIPPRSPRANAYAERWVRTVRAGVTDLMLIAGPRHPRAVLDEYAAHCNRHRSHRARSEYRPVDKIAEVKRLVSPYLVLSSVFRLRGIVLGKEAIEKSTS